MGIPFQGFIVILPIGHGICKVERKVFSAFV
jgi:hypothetical protein